MKTCILHYAIMDSDGNLSTDCKRHNTLEEAKTAQANLNNRFKELALQIQTTLSLKSAALLTDWS